MDIEKSIASNLCEWASSHDAIAALWLFGSRAKGTSRKDSDFDIAIELRPAKGDHDWAYGDFVSCYEVWKCELRRLVNGDVSLVSFRDDFDTPFDPRHGGIRLWLH